jgi:hypothetical protein
VADLKSYTSKYSFPYPLDGDSVQNTYKRIQELAERIEATYVLLDINLSGSAKLMQEGDAAGGDLTGSYPNPSITSGAITNAKVASDAGIVYSKLNLANSIVSSDIVNGTITGSDITSSVSLGGNPTTTTQSVTDNSTRIATTEFVQDLFAESQGTAFDTHVQNVTDAHSIDIPHLVYTTDVGSVTSTMLANNSIVNADVNSAAAISYSKLSLAGSILESDLAFSIATQGELDAHTSASTSVHGISNTANLVYTSDSRLSDARTPTTHASSHGSAGSDPVTIAPSQVTGTAVITSDSRLTDSRTPTGAAGGVLSGTYPNPGFAVDMATQGELDTHTGATTSVHGISNTANLVYTSDSRLNDARTPTSHAGTHVPGGSDVLDYTKIIGYGTSLPTWNATTHPAGVLWVVNTVGEPYSLYRSDGVSAWKQVGGGGASITVSDTAPSSPVAGAMWYDSTTGKTFIRYADGSSSQWVEIGEASQLSVPSHGSSHVRGGSDIIDGDRLTVDYVPTRYTRNSAASGAGDNTDLTAHLGGIDNNLTSLWVPPMCRVYRGAQSSFTSSIITFTSEDYDTYNMFTPSGNAITIPVSGVYLLNAWAQVSGSSAFTYASIELGYNSTAGNLQVDLMRPVSSTDYRGGTSAQVYFSAGSTVNAYIGLSGGGTVTLQAASFQVALLGKTV